MNAEIISSRWFGRMLRAVQLIGGVYIAYVLGQSAAVDYGEYSQLVWLAAGAMAVRSHYWLKEVPKMTPEARRREWLAVLGAWCGMAFLLGWESALAVSR